MDLKKVLILLITLFLCIGAFFTVGILSDKEKPEISINNNEVSIGCEVSFDELLKNASAKDDEGIKEFFIEENNFVDIVNNRKLTYVAIDNNNNVTKEVLYIDVLDEVMNKKIEIIKELEVEVRHDFLLNDYFKVTNECGWEFETNLEVVGMDLNKIGTYDIEVKALKENNIPVLKTQLTVKDFETPIITLSKNEITINKGELFDFKSLIKNIEDNKDTKEYLLSTLEISDINTNAVGTHEVFISITDSDGKVARVKVLVVVEGNEIIENNNEENNQGTIPNVPEVKPEQEKPNPPIPVDPSPETKPEQGGGEVNPSPEPKPEPPIEVDPKPETEGETNPENQNGTEVPVV